MTVELDVGQARRRLPADPGRRQPDWRANGRGNAQGERAAGIGRRAAGRCASCAGSRSPRLKIASCWSSSSRPRRPSPSRQATIRQRDADLKLAEVNRDRNRNLYERQLISRQTYDDTEARYQAAEAQVDLAQAQLLAAQVPARRAQDQPVEHHHHLAGERVRRLPRARPRRVGDAQLRVPVARRHQHRPAGHQRGRARPSPHSGGSRRRRRGRRLSRARSSTDASSHMAPILDPATRTAQIEIEIPNPGGQLKPGMYAKVNFTVDKRENTLVVPANAVVDLGGKRGVFLPGGGQSGDVPGDRAGRDDHRAGRSRVRPERGREDHHDRRRSAARRRSHRAARSVAAEFGRARRQRPRRAPRRTRVGRRTRRRARRGPRRQQQQPASAKAHRFGRAPATKR